MKKKVLLFVFLMYTFNVYALKITNDMLGGRYSVVVGEAITVEEKSGYPDPPLWSLEDQSLLEAWSHTPTMVGTCGIGYGGDNTKVDVYPASIAGTVLLVTNSMLGGTYSMTVGQTVKIEEKVGYPDPPDWELHDGSSISAWEYTPTVVGVYSVGYGGKNTNILAVAAAVSVTNVSLSPTSLLGQVGGQGSLTATVSPSNATDKSVTWSSSNSSVATVTNGTVNYTGVGSATITVKTNDGNHTATANVTVSSATVSVTGVSLSPSSLSGVVGGSGSLTATVDPSNATDKSVTWSSSNSSVATVTNGTVNYTGVGSATITVKTNDGNHTATANVTVSSATVSVTGVSLSPSSLSGVVGGSGSLTATVDPLNATDKSVTWSSSNSSVATVTNGMVNYTGVGSATITVKTNDGNHTATANVTVSSTTVSVTGVSLSPSSLSGVVGGSGSLTATVNPLNATDKSVTWSSSNSSVATVTNGTVNYTGVGSVTITVKTNDGNHTATANVTVSSATVSVTGVSLCPSSLSGVVGGSGSLTATVNPSNATDKSVTWSSSNSSVATVTNGTVNYTGVGSATITVKTNDGNHTATANVTVSSATVSVTGVSLSPSSLSGVVGGSGSLTATVNPSNATDKSVTWSSSNSSVATVMNGTVNYTGVGSATITAKTNDGNYTATCAVTIVDIPDGVEAVVDETLSVWGAGNALYIKSSSEEGTVFVYSISGKLVKAVLYYVGELRVQLSSGVYVVRTDQKMFKVIIQ
jgi:uncharacterized protein YjdB